MIQSFRKALFQKSLTFSFSSRQAIFCNKERVCAKEQVLVPALFDDEAFTSQAFLVFLYQFFAKVRFWSIFKCTSITKCLCVRTRATDLFATLADLGLHLLLVFGGLLRVAHEWKFGVVVWRLGWSVDCNSWRETVNQPEATIKLAGCCAIFCTII